MGQVVGTYLMNRDGTHVDQDPTSAALVTICHDHHMIHAGRHFFINGYVDLTSGQVLDWLFVTPPASTGRNIHFLLEVAFEAEATLAVYEGVTVATNGVVVPSYCSNRIVDATALSATYYAPTSPVVGTPIARIITGSGRLTGGGGRAEHEMVMKADTKYLFRITNNTATTNWFNYMVDWYENVDGE